MKLEKGGFAGDISTNHSFLRTDVFFAEL